MPNKLLKYCVIPAGGLGTRWEPVTNHIPKVMIPLYDRPTIDWIIKESIDSGSEEIILVIDKNKELVKKHVSKNKKLQKKANIHFTYKKRVRGVAEAMLLGKKIVGSNYFSMIVSDHPCFYKTPPLKKMAKKFNAHKDDMGMLSFAKYPKYNNLAYGECKLEKKGDLYTIRHLCPRPEKPGINHHKDNNLRITGRYIFNPKIYPYINQALQTKRDEDLSDWDVFKLAHKNKEVYYGMEVKEHFLDMGTPETYGISSKFLFQRYSDEL